MKMESLQWLWCLALLPVLYGVGFYEVTRRKKALGDLFSRSLWSEVIPHYRSRVRKLRLLLFTLALGFVIFALARPQWGVKEETVSISGMDVLVVFDISQSMYVEDVIPSRIKKAKYFVRNLVQRLQGDRFGLISFAGGAEIVSPLTTDIDYFIEALDTLSSDMASTPGTDIGLALEAASQALDRGAEDLRKEKNDLGPPSRVVVLVTDGEDHEGLAQPGAELIQETGARLYIFGVGSQKGGTIPVWARSGRLKGYKKDRSGNPVVSRFNPESLKALANTGGGRYWDITDDLVEVEQFLAETGNLDRGKLSERKYLIHQERFQIPLALAVLLLLIEMSFSLRRHVPKKGLKVVLGIFCLFGAQSAFADEDVNAPAYLKNREAIQDLKDKKFKAAKEKFKNASELDPHSPELKFNSAVGEIFDSQGKENKDRLDSASALFQESAQEALKAQKYELAGRSYYNLGSVYNAKGDYRKSIESYLKALDIAELSGNQNLAELARRQIERQQQRHQQQQQQKREQEKKEKQEDQKNQQKQDEGEEQDKEKSSDQSQSGDQKDDQEESQGKDQKDEEDSSSQGKEGDKQKKFKSEKLSKEDAERVMSELSQREKELKKRLNRRKGKNRNVEKDW